jgi:hypothetical protein
MSRRRVDHPHCAVVVVDHVPYAAATGDLVLPLLEIAAVVPVSREITAKSVLSLVVRAGTWLSA